MTTIRMIALVGACALLGALAIPVAAAPPVQLITPYPSVSVEAGKSITFNLEVRTPARQRVMLEILQAPAGWQATLRGGGFVIQGVYGAPEDPPQVQLDVKVPPDAAKGDYQVVARATSGGASDTLALNLRVAEVVAGAVTLTAEFPSLRGPSDTTFRYNVTLTNNTPETTTFNLVARGPEGWNVQARPATQTQAATLKVDGGATGAIEVEADPPQDVSAGTFEIGVRADGGASKQAEAVLTAEITGTAKLTLTTPTERLNAKAVAGRASELALVVRNEGTTALRGVKLSATPPAGWRVTFRPSTVPDIAPNQTGRVTAIITPSGEAVAGDYVVSFTASGELSSSNTDIRVSVSPSRLFGFVGLAIILGAAFVLFWVFRRYGRR